MAGLPKKIDFLARMPPDEGVVDPPFPLASPPQPDPFVSCGVIQTPSPVDVIVHPGDSPVAIPLIWDFSSSGITGSPALVPLAGAYTKLTSGPTPRANPKIFDSVFTLNPAIIPPSTPRVHDDVGTVSWQDGTGQPCQLELFVDIAVILPLPPPPPPYFGNLNCVQGTPLILEPSRFSPDSSGWYGGIEDLSDPFYPTEEEYVGSQTLNGVVGVEFPLPVNRSPVTSDSGLIISARYDGTTTTSASLHVTLQYFDLSDNLWHNNAFTDVVLTGSYLTTYLANILSSLPSSQSITKIRITVIVKTLVSAPSKTGEVRFNHLTIPYCSVIPTVLPPSPPPPASLTEPIQPPDQSAALPLEIMTNDLPHGHSAVAYSAKLLATGGYSPYSWSLIGGIGTGLPANVTLSTNGVISGTPTSAGTSTFRIGLADGKSQPQTVDLSIIIGAISVLPPPPFPLPSPPLPPGSEILRPNRDILVKLWNPRPAFMQLNDPLNLDDPVDVAVPLYGPASVDTFDEATGNYTGTIRPRVEVGFTAPVTAGPWDALQLRFRATRSRPPQPETPAPPLPIPATKEPVIYLSPPVQTQTLTPRGTDFPGVWQIPPLELELKESVDKPVNPPLCYISAPASIPPGAPGQISLTPSPIKWDAGYNQIQVRLIAMAQGAKVDPDATSITGYKVNSATFAPTPMQVTEGYPPYQVTWNPFGCGGKAQYYTYSPTEIRGMGVLATNIDIHAEFFIPSKDPDHLEAQVSTDGVRYYTTIAFDLKAFQSTVIYYRIALNRGGLATPVGQISAGVGLVITGPSVVTGINVIMYPQVPVSAIPFTIEVDQGIDSSVPLVSQCRVGVSLRGNMELMQSPVQYTGTLGSDWPASPYVLTWNGFWSTDNIKDLRIRLSPEALVLGDDVPFINISALDVKISPWYPGISPPLSQPLIKLNQVDIVPVNDVSVTGWTPVPAWSRLVKDPELVSYNDVVVNLRTPNQLLVEMGDPVGFPPVPYGYTREWVAIEAIIQARIITWSSLQANLLVSTTLGQEQLTPALTQDQALYRIIWNYNPGLTVDQVNRLKVGIIANDLTRVWVNPDPVEASVSALTLRLTFQDVWTTVSPPSPPPLVDTIITVVESDHEIFSCGSLGDCGAPQGRITAKVTVTNPDPTPATVNFITDGNIHIRVSDSNSNTYNLSQTITAHASITFFIYGWVGDQTDSFPIDAEDGNLIISLIYSAGVHQVNVPWYYLGL